MEDRTPKPGEIYRHFKNKTYQVLAIAHHSETEELLVIYQALYGNYGVCARPLDMFVSEVDHEKYPEVTQKYRFEKVEMGGMCMPAFPTAEKQTEPSSEKIPDQTPEGQKPDLEKEEREKETLEKEKGGETCPGDGDSDEMESLDPRIMEFLDAEDMETRYNILVSLQSEITDSMIDTFAVALDLVIPEGDTLRRYDQLKMAVRTRQKYETANRLR